MKEKMFLGLIVFLALILRVYNIGGYPIGFTQDEAAQGYDAYSILLTGKDQWGKMLPLTLRSLGDFKLPLYTYFTVPSVAIFGLNEFSVRFPNAVLGTLAVIATYLMVKIITGKKDFALLSALLFSISAWHISLSRGAFEANVTTLLMPLGIWLFYEGMKKPKFMVLAAFIFGLNLFSYHSARIFTPLLLTVLVFINRKHFRNSSWSRYRVGILVFALFFVTALYTSFTGAQKRGLDLSLLNPTDKWQAVSDRRYEAVIGGLPDTVSRLFSNKLAYVTYHFVNNYLTYLSPSVLFTQGVSGWDNGMIPGRGVLYLIEVVFIVLSVFFFLRRREQSVMTLFFIWLLISPIPAAISKGSGFVGTRGAVMMPALQIASAWGLYILINFLKKRGKVIYRLSLVFTTFILLFSLLSFLEDYYFHTPLKSAQSMQYGRKEMIDYISSIESSYQEIFISRTVSAPNIWVQFYKVWDPVQVQESTEDWIAYEKYSIPYLDQFDGYKLGNYTFGSIHPNELKDKGEVLVIGKPEEFKRDAIPLKIFYFPNKTPAFYAVESNSI